MKCVKIVDKKKLEVSEIDKPVSSDDKVIIKVESCGICGSDIHNWDLGEPKGLVMGHEFAGVISDSGFSNFNVGDRVTSLPISPCLECDACKTGNYQYCRKTWNDAIGLSINNPGGFGEYVSVRSDMIKKLPDNVSFDEASMIEPASVGLHAINLANIKVGDKVLIVGGGIIGLMSAEFAKMNGASYVCLLETNEKRGNKAIELGIVDEYLNALDENIVGKMLEKSNGGFDKVIECCGNSGAVTEAIMGCIPGGDVILVGVSVTNVSIPLVVAVMSEIRLQGSIAYTEQEFVKVIDLISDKKIDVLKYIDAKVGLDDVQVSFERLTSGDDDAIKIVVKP